MSKTNAKGREKSGGAEAAPAGGGEWDLALTSAVFEEETWKPCVTWLEGRQVEDFKHIDALNTVVQTGIRKLFSVVTKDQLYADVCDLGDPKNKGKAKEIPANSEVCEACKPYLDAGDPIPPPLLARLIKWKLMSIKTTDVKRREQESKDSHLRPTHTTQISKVDLSDAGSDKKKGKEDKGKDRAKSPKKGGKKTPEPQAAKEGSKMRKRGEEDSDSKFIDDEPEDGASHYILVSGFHNPQLFHFLEEVGVSLSSVVGVSTQDYDKLKKNEQVGQGESEIVDPEFVKEEELRQEMKTFWKDLLPLLQKTSDSSTLHNIARLDYEVKSMLVHTDPKEMEAEQRGSMEDKVAYSTALFEDVAVMIYDLLDAKRLYKTYLDNLNLVKVQPYGQEKGHTGTRQKSEATPVPPTTPGRALEQVDTTASELTEKEKVPPPPVDMRFYNDLMNTIPQESVSVPLVMHCILEQISASEEGVDPPSEQAAPLRSDGLNFNLASYLSDVAQRLGLSEKDHNLLSEVLDLPKPPPEEPSPPELVNIQDGIGIRTLHLKPHYGFDAGAVERSMLQFLPFARLCNMVRPTSADMRLRAARLQELIHFCATDGLSKSEIDRAFKQFVFESMDLASTDPNGFLLRKDKEGLQHTPVPWDDPYPYFKVMVPLERDKMSINIPTPSEDRSGKNKNKHKLDKLEKANMRLNSNHVSETKLAPAKPQRVAGQSGAMLEIEIKLGMGACTPEPDTAPTSSGSAKDPNSRPPSTDSKRGILVAKRASQHSATSSKRSRSNSVHWGGPVPREEDMEFPGVDGSGTKTVSQSMMEVVDAQQRNLDQWCFAEHFKSHILAQMLSEASYHLPFTEVYQHKRDQTLMLVLHNPHNAELQNHVDWHKELHSNMGFRNYLEYTAESITEWLKEKEAEYQASMLSKEVDKMTKDDDDKAKDAEKANAKGGKKSPRKSPSRGKSPRGSRSTTPERPTSSSNPYMRQGSLKAWQAEQDKIAQEEEEKEREKLNKRTRSAEKRQKEKVKPKEKKRGSDDEKEKSERSKSPGARGSASRSRASKAGGQTLNVDTESKSEQSEQSPPEPERFWPFSGYDTGNQMIHVSGITTTLFPSDGGRIKTERTEFVQGTTSIRSVLQKDDHIFSIHILNPREDMNLPEDWEDKLAEDEGILMESDSTAEKADTENTEKEVTDENKEGDILAEGAESEIKMRKSAVSQFGSVTAQLSDGMVLALSQFGAKGESYLKPYEPALFVAPQTVESPSLQNPASPSKGKGKDAKKGVPTPEPERLSKASNYYDDEPVEEEKKDDEKPLPKQEFQELFVTCPDGLSVKYFLQSSVGVTPNSAEDRQLAVRQSYPFKTRGVQECESSRRKYMMTEMSRVITADGSVVKNMVDGSVEVLSADGTVSVFTGTWKRPSSRTSSPSRSLKSADQRETPTKHLELGTAKGSAKKMKSDKTIQDLGTDEDVKLSSSVGCWVITYPSGERLQVNKESGDCLELAPVPICLATDPDSQQTMATRDDHVITVSYPDGTTVVEHADGTRITVYYRESAVASPMGDMDSPAAPDTQTLKFVKVECPSFATVEFNTATSENLTVFGSGTSINVFPDGYYILHHSAGGRVEVDTEGTMVYFPRRSRFLEHLLPERELQYVLRHNADVILETVDPDGNVFNIRSTGDYNVIPVQTEEELSDSDEERDGKAKPSKSKSKEVKDKDPKKITQYAQHAPRFFIVHADGSGTELLRYQDVAEYLMMSEQNPATAVLKDSLADHPGVTGITILKPYLSGLSERWFKKYDQESIVPQGIRCRDLKTLPPREYKRPGPHFGTNVGKGLNIGALNTKGPTRIPILKCPNKLELRQVVQYRPVSEHLRSKLVGGLRGYAENVVSRIHAGSIMSVGDPRSEGEKILAQDLHATVEAQRKENRDCEPEHVKSVYEQAILPPPPSPPPTPQAKRTMADWERDRRELNEEKEAKSKIAGKLIEPYFESELGKAFLLTQASDMDEMMRRLATDDPHRETNDTTRGDTSSRLTYTQSPGYTTVIPPYQHNYDHNSVATFEQQKPTVKTRSQRSSNAGNSVMSDRSTNSESPGTLANKTGQETPLSCAGAMSEAPTMTPSGGVRPGNPTPAHATGQGSPAPLRPTNPTPAHAGKQVNDRPESLIRPMKTARELLKDMEMKSTDRELSQHQGRKVKALTTNVSGDPRSESVQLPVSIKGGRPGAHPNMRYRETEDPVRREIKTSMVAGATVKGKQHLGMMRGFICQPEGVNFGVLKEGCTYAFSVTLRNTGVDTCRFKIRQPPPATGLRVVYKPGPVAAGMSVDLTLELYAIANGVEGESGVGSLGHVLEVVTETDILEIPTVATILTAHEYDNPEMGSGLRETQARLVSTRPPASHGIIRPRKDPKAFTVSG